MKKILVFILVCFVGLGVAGYLLDSGVDWKKYPPELKRKLDLMTNCLDLQKELIIVLRKDTFEINRGVYGKNTGLKEYIGARLKDRGCPGGF